MKTLYVLVLIFQIFLEGMSYGVEYWANTYGLTGSHLRIEKTFDGGYVVIGGIIVTPYVDYDFCVMKVNLIGNIEWQKTYGGGLREIARSIQQTTDGGYIITGWTETFGNGMWVLKLNNSGGIGWQKSLWWVKLKVYCKPQMVGI